MIPEKRQLLIKMLQESVDAMQTKQWKVVNTPREAIYQIWVDERKAMKALIEDDATILVTDQ